MHEAHLLDDLLAKIEAVAATENARRVVAVTVWLGALSHFTAEHFREHFDDAVRDTIAVGAKLEVIVSGDIHAPNATGIVLKDIEVEP